MPRQSNWVMLAGSLVVCGLTLSVGAQQSQPAGEQERKVKEAEVPAAALAALKKAAGGAPFTEFAEEIEHGHTFYEGTFKGTDGEVDALVTAEGDLVEIEESIAAEKAPAAVRAPAEKAAGADAKLHFEKKTMILYEVHFRKDGKGREMILTPDGRRFYEHAAMSGEPAAPKPGEKGDAGEDDRDEDDDDGE